MGQKHLTKTHREIIERFLGEKSIRSIAVLLGYSPAAISKEVRRNANKNARYDAQAAQRRADWRASKDKNAGKRTVFLAAYVQEGLRNQSVSPFSKVKRSNNSTIGAVNGA